MKIYQIDRAGYLTGAVGEVGDEEGIPVGWVSIEPPSPAIGEYAVWTGLWGVSLQPAPPPDPATAFAERDRLMARATTRIAPLQDAVDIDDASPAEIALLKKWKQYRIALNRIQDQPGFPPDIVWPEAPE